MKTANEQHECRLCKGAPTFFFVNSVSIRCLNARWRDGFVVVRLAGTGLFLRGRQREKAVRVTRPYVRVVCRPATVFSPNSPLQCDENNV